MINPPKPYYTPRRYPASAIMAVSCQVVLAALLVIAATYFIAPMHRGTNYRRTAGDLGRSSHGRYSAGFSGAIDGALPGWCPWGRHGRTACLEAHPAPASRSPRSTVRSRKFSTDGEARDVLQRPPVRRGGSEGGARGSISPLISPCPRDAELKNVLVVGRSQQRQVPHHSRARRSGDRARQAVFSGRKPRSGRRIYRHLSLYQGETRVNAAPAPTRNAPATGLRDPRGAAVAQPSQDAPPPRPGDTTSLFFCHNSSTRARRRMFSCRRSFRSRAALGVRPPYCERHR